MHPVPAYVYVVEGTVTVEMNHGSPREYAAGSGCVESVNSWHNGKNLGQAPVKVLVVFVSEEGKKNLIRPEGQPKSRDLVARISTKGVNQLRGVIRATRAFWCSPINS